MSLEIPKTVEGWRETIEWIDDLKLRTKAGSDWVDAMRYYSLNSLYFFGFRILNIGRAVHNPFGVLVYDHQAYVDLANATEYQFEKGKGLSCVSRRAGKSEWRSCAFPLWCLIRNPDLAISIVSVEKALAMRHLQRIKNELEGNDLLKYLFDDVLWIDPQTEAKSRSVTWSKADGFVIKGRKMNRANSSIEVNALFGGGPIGSGYDIIVADDIERRDRVSTQEAADDLDAAFSEAMSLMTPIAIRRPCVMISNTRFSQIGLVNRKAIEFAAEDPGLVFEWPAEIIEEGQNESYVYDHDLRGPLGGKISWPYSEEYLFDIYSKMLDKSEYVLQFANSFRSLGDRSLDEHKIHYYEDRPVDKAKDCVVYLGVDPSKGKHDPCAIWVWGVTADEKYVWLDAKIGNLDITDQRFHDELFGLVMKWNNLSQRVIQVRVEDTANSDWAALVGKELMARGVWTPVVKVLVRANIAERKFKTGKHDRIFAHWAPPLNRGDIWFPLPSSKGGRGILYDMNNDGNPKDLVDYMLNTEIRPFPSGKHDDGLDAGGMLFDEKTNQDWPIVTANVRQSDESSRIGGSYGHSTTWMSAG